MDTNVLYAGLRSSSGASFQILRAIENRTVVLLLSQTVLSEYEEVLRFYADSIPLSFSEIDTVLDFLCLEAERVEYSGPWNPILDDAADEAFVKLASVGKANFILTHNVRHFTAAAQIGVNVLAPKEILGMI